MNLREIRYHLGPDEFFTISVESDDKNDPESILEDFTLATICEQADIVLAYRKAQAAGGPISEDYIKQVFADVESLEKRIIDAGIALNALYADEDIVSERIVNGTVMLN